MANSLDDEGSGVLEKTVIVLWWCVFGVLRLSSGWVMVVVFLLMRSTRD